MALLDSIGLVLAVGGQNNVAGAAVAALKSSYIVETSQDGAKEVDDEEIQDEDGIPTSRLIFSRRPIFTAKLRCKSDAAPLTDFPEGDMCVIVGLTAYYVRSAAINQERGNTTVDIDLLNVGYV